MFNLSLLSKNILANKWLIIVLVLIGTLFFGNELKKLEIDADIVRSLPDDDADAKLLKKNWGEFWEQQHGGYYS